MCIVDVYCGCEYIQGVLRYGLLIIDYFDARWFELWWRLEAGGG